jgi:RNA polymerase sigma-70 factor (ECF subfamily)
VSLDAPVNAEDDTPTWRDVLGRQMAETSTPTADETIVRLDLLRLVAALTPQQQRLCALLAEEGLTVTEVAERLGVSRPTVYDELRKLRKLFAAHGLQHYLRE